MEYEDLPIATVVDVIEEKHGDTRVPSDLEGSSQEEDDHE